VVFCRCQNAACPHCSKLPKPSEAVQFLWKHGCVPFISVPSPIDPDHFMTFLEFCHYTSVGGVDMNKLYDRHCP
jgi:hypothetical protein